MWPSTAPAQSLVWKSTLTIHIYWVMICWPKANCSNSITWKFPMHFPGSRLRELLLLLLTTSKILIPVHCMLKKNSIVFLKKNKTLSDSKPFSYLMCGQNYRQEGTDGWVGRRLFQPVGGLAKLMKGNLPKTEKGTAMWDVLKPRPLCLPGSFSPPALPHPPTLRKNVRLSSWIWCNTALWLSCVHARDWQTAVPLSSNKFSWHGSPGCGPRFPDVTAKQKCNAAWGGVSLWGQCYFWKAIW